MVAMSGGVDSSVAAAILLQEGYEVIGVTMQIWPQNSEADDHKERSCCSLSAVDDARRVANKLGIPYYVMNFRNIFEDKVINYFKNEYLQGRTPNPCIACNRHVKFEAMIDKAVAMGMDYVATGHYAKIVYDEKLKRYVLKKSVTDHKDQTYALYNMNQYQLERTLMPVGNFTKDEIRDQAKELELNVAAKPDSQEICFVLDGNYADFINKNTNKGIEQGCFLDKNGNVLGKHKGIINYTIGQRKGLGIALGKPMFVIEIDAKKNNVILGEEEDLYSDTLIASDLNFISIDKLHEPRKIKAKIRYSAKEEGATIFPMDEKKVKVVFNNPQRAITKGQSVVFYEDDIVLGGGIIN